MTAKTIEVPYFYAVFVRESCNGMTTLSAIPPFAGLLVKEHLRMFWPTSRMQSGTGTSRLGQIRDPHRCAKTGRPSSTCLEFNGNSAGATLP